MGVGAVCMAGSMRAFASLRVPAMSPLHLWDPAASTTAVRWPCRMAARMVFILGKGPPSLRHHGHGMPALLGSSIQSNN